LLNSEFDYNDAMKNSTIEVIQLSENPEVSVIIPHFYQGRKENFDGLIQDIKNQTFRSLEIIVVNGVSPQGKAINEGVRKARGKVLVVMDDDSRIGHKQVIENLLKALETDRQIAMAGASVLTPNDANAFQKSAARQFPRFNMPVVKEVIDSDLACHGCVAFRRNIFEEVGMEREDILRGLDPDLRVRIRKAGYRVVLVPDTWAYHPLPDSLPKLASMFFRNGYGAAYIQKTHPEINYDTHEQTDSSNFVAKRPLWYRMLRYPGRLLESLFKFQWLRFIAYSVYVFGYAWGFIQFYVLGLSPLNPTKK